MASVRLPLQLQRWTSLLSGSKSSAPVSLLLRRFFSSSISSSSSSFLSRCPRSQSNPLGSHTLATQTGSSISHSSSVSSTLNHVGKRFLHFDIADGLTEEQKEMQRVALDFAQKEMAPYADKWDAEKIFPEETLRKAASLGFGGLYVRSDVGGSELSRRDSALIFEALSTACVSTTALLTIHNMCCWMIDSFGTEEQRQKYLPDLISCKKFASYCLTEPGAGSDAASLRTTAKKKSSSSSTYLLNGTKAFISGGGRSEVYVVMARTGSDGPKGISCFIVESSFPGISFGAQEKKLGWNSQPTAAVILEDAEVPAENMLGKEGEGFKIAMKGLDGGRINIATTAIGGALTAYSKAVDHVKVRKQFGQSLSHFQSIQFKLSEMFMALHSSRLLIGGAAEKLDGKAHDATVHCAMAKKIATESAFNVCNDALQLHGGYGYLRDYGIERYLRDVRVHSILEGTNQVMQMIISRHILNERK